MTKLVITFTILRKRLKTADQKYEWNYKTVSKKMRATVVESSKLSDSSKGGGISDSEQDNDFGGF
jgi:hypothetical protein